MKQFIRSGMLLVGLAFAAGAVTAADMPAGNSEADTAGQLQRIQEQLREMHDEIGKLSNRIEKIEALIPQPPKQEKVNVNLAGAPRFGSSNAKIGMVEFSDYQCPFCRRFHQQTFPQLQKAYIDTGKVMFAVKNFPLNFHPHAIGAALAVNCARQQNIKAFWSIQEDLFAHQNRLGNDFYNELVKQYGLDQKKFSSCVNAPEQKKAIAADLKYAQSLHVSGTPTFFIGRLEGDQLVDAVRVVGARPYADFTEVLDSFAKPDDAKKM